MAGLYIHIPFEAPPESSREPPLVDAVLTEMDQQLSRLDVPPSFRTIYIGGTGVTMLPLPSFRPLMDGLHRRVSADASREITIEQNPTVDASLLQSLSDLGITRVSFTSSPSLDRQLRAIRDAHDAGIPSASVDLEFGGASTNLADWKEQLHRVAQGSVPHLALDETAREEDDRGAVSRADCFAFAMRFLAAKGYAQYELTHFARPGHQSRYQTLVYNHGNVLGLGPGAESFWWPDRTAPSTARRWSNVSDPGTYVGRIQDGRLPRRRHNDLDRPALAREYLLLRLRTDAGVDLDLLDDRYGVALRNRHPALLDHLATEGLVHDEPRSLRLTPRGRLLADAVTERLIRDL